MHDLPELKRLHLSSPPPNATMTDPEPAQPATVHLTLVPPHWLHICALSSCTYPPPPPQKAAYQSRALASKLLRLAAHFPLPLATLEQKHQFTSDASRHKRRNVGRSLLLLCIWMSCNDTGSSAVSLTCGNTCFDANLPPEHLSQTHSVTQTLYS